MLCYESLKEGSYLVMEEEKKNRSIDQNDVKNINEIVAEKESLIASKDKMYRLLYESSQLSEENVDEDLMKATVKTLRILENDEMKILNDKIKTMQEVIDEQYEERLKLEKKLKLSKKLTKMVASFILVLSLSSVIANALGYNFLDMVVQWEDETFNLSFGEEEQKIEQQIQKKVGQTENYIRYNHLDMVLAEIDPQIKYPTWFPDGFVFNYAEEFITDGYDRWILYYMTQDKEIVLDIIVYKSTDKENFAFEKDKNEMHLYEKNGVSHYIMSNLGQLQAVWRQNNSVSNIRGDISLDEMKKVINSIYGG
jgi:hypothetical protein